jgi:hypothetical protein
MTDLFMFSFSQDSMAIVMSVCILFTRLWNYHFKYNQHFILHKSSFVKPELRSNYGKVNLTRASSAIRLTWMNTTESCPQHFIFQFNYFINPSLHLQCIVCTQQLIWRITIIMEKWRSEHFHCDVDNTFTQHSLFIHSSILKREKMLAFCLPQEIYR